MKTAPARHAGLRKEPRPQPRQLLLLLLAVTLLRGLVYVAIMPPWQHYDEPSRFEHIRLLVERGRPPRYGEYDLAMRREIAASMWAFDFWKDIGQPSLDFGSDTPPEIGVDEGGRVSLYYYLLAIPQLLAGHQDVETQLYLGRLVSLLFYLVIVVAAYGLVRELFPGRRWLPLIVATFISLLPPFTDLVSGLNNDVGAAAATSLFLWASVRLVRRGLTLGRAALTLLLAGVGIVTKNAAGTVSAVVLAALALGYLSQHRRRWLWVGLGLAVPVLLLSALTWGRQAAHWQNLALPADRNWMQAETPLGSAVLFLTDGEDGVSRAIFQELERDEGRRLRGQTVTFGAWIRTADGGGGLASLTLDDGGLERWYDVEAAADWQFHAFTATVGLDARSVALRVDVGNREQGAGEVYLDGLVLVTGDLAAAPPPHFDTALAATGQWDGQPFTNLLQNGSAEKGWPGLRPWLGNQTLFRWPINHIFQSIWDWPRTSWVYRPELINIFQSFWGRFGWNHLALPSAWFYVLGLVTAAALAGAAVGLVRRLQSETGIEPWKSFAWIVLGLALLASWLSTLVRIHPVFLTGMTVYWPVARYASPVIVLTSTLLCVGLAEIVPRRWAGEAAYAGLLGLVLLDAVAVCLVILPYYYYG